MASTRSRQSRLSSRASLAGGSLGLDNMMSNMKLDAHNNGSAAAGGGGEHRLSSRQSMAGTGSSRMSHSRRSSAYSGLNMANPNNGRLSSAGYATLPSTKDPRPIRDKQWQNSSIRSLIQFLTQVNYPHPISQKMLLAPSSKDFQTIFRFLYAILDPNYKYEKKFEDEVPIILKGLRYPFEINKSHLASVGAPHSWPSYLAVLIWMMELIMCCDRLDRPEDYEDAVSATDSKHLEKLFLEYLTKAYSVFLDGEDNFEAMDQELLDKFDMKNSEIIFKINQLEQHNVILDKEWNELNASEPPLVRQQSINQSLVSDISKFENYISVTEGKKEQLSQFIVKQKEDICTKESELNAVNQEIARLQEIIENQEVSPQDVIRMNAERDQLQNTLDMIRAKQEEYNTSIWKMEIEINKFLHKMDKTFKKFNDLALNIDLAKTASFPEEFELKLNVLGVTPEEMSSLDLKEKVKPSLLKTRANYRSNVHRIQDELIALQEQVERFTELCSDKREELDELDQGIKKLNASYVEQKEATSASIVSSGKEKERLEREIQKIRLENQTKLVQSNEQLQKMKIEIDNARTLAEERTEKNLGVFYKMIEDYMRFIEHTDQTFNELRDMSAFELSGEAY